jgi:hypothetical protein
MLRIFTKIIEMKLTYFDDEKIKTISEEIAKSTYKLFSDIESKLMATPSKPHYAFSMKDRIKVIQGLLKVDKNYCENEYALMKLRANEATCVISDRLVCLDDQKNSGKSLKTFSARDTALRKTIFMERENQRKISKRFTSNLRRRSRIQKSLRPLRQFTLK